MVVGCCLVVSKVAQIGDVIHILLDDLLQSTMQERYCRLQVKILLKMSRFVATNRNLDRVEMGSSALASLTGIGTSK